MAEEPSSGSLDEQLKSQLALANQLLMEIKDVRQKAQSEALFAFQAKQNCEEHSTFITQKKGVVEADVAAISSHKQSVADFVATISTAKAALDSDQAAIATQKVESKAALLAIQEAAQTTDKIATVANETKTAIDVIHRSIQALEKTIKTSSDGSVSSAASIAQSLSEIATHRTAAIDSLGKIKKDEEASGELLKQAKQYVAENQDVLTQVQAVNKEYVEMVELLKRLQSDSEKLKIRVEELLPGATSAALASSFKQQADRFRWPKRNWMACFILCIGGLIGIAVPGFVHQFSAPTSWDSLLLEFVHRLPILVPLVWLAVYAGRNYMMAVRLEEDYSYKEAVSRAFEGYKEQMQSLGDGDAADVRPLMILCNNVLKAIAERPGRIYEGAQKDVTPMNVVLEGAAEGSKHLRNRISAV